MKPEITRQLTDTARRVYHAVKGDRRDPYRQSSYSQDGEDRILASLLANQNKGFFVDVGAHHPKRFSNTYLFYERGWQGINIDPTPGTREAFEALRPLDTNLELGIASTAGKLDFYLYDEPAFNSFSESAYRLFAERGFPKLVEKKQVETLPLASVLEKHLPEGQSIDFLSVDAEGMDLAVLQSNDWKRFRPRIVVAEDGQDVASSLNSPLSQFLQSQHYRFVSRTTISVIWLAEAPVD